MCKSWEFFHGYFSGKTEKIKRNPEESPKSGMGGGGGGPPMEDEGDSEGWSFIFGVLEEKYE